MEAGDALLSHAPIPAFLRQRSPSEGLCLRPVKPFGRQFGQSCWCVLAGWGLKPLPALKLGFESRESFFQVCLYRLRGREHPGDAGRFKDALQHPGICGFCPCKDQTSLAHGVPPKDGDGEPPLWSMDPPLLAPFSSRSGFPAWPGVPGCAQRAPIFGVGQTEADGCPAL